MPAIKNKLKPKPRIKKTTKGKPSKVNSRARRKHYITGTHHSPKCLKPIDYRSGWEKEICEYLDYCPEVVSYIYEGVAIPYISNQKTGKIRLYFPDFLIQYTDGRKVLVEVKREDKLSDPTVMKKTEAGKQWASSRGIQFQLWTNKLIKQVKEMNEARTKKQHYKQK